MQIKRELRRPLTAILVLGLLVTVAAARHPDAVGRRGMVVSGSPIASRYGLNILRRGGNAVDAAVAVGFALAVTTPRAGNLGGGGFMVIRFSDGTATTIDFREKAPAAASRNMYLDDQGAVIDGLSTYGALASGVPGTVRGFGLAHEKYGSLPWDMLLAESANLAETGFAVSYQLHRDLVRRERFLTQFKATRELFYPRGRPLNLNALFRQPDLAATLRRIALQGPDEFYTGETARLLATHMGRREGFITLRDLADYQAVERPPIVFDYRDTRVFTMGPPSSGGVVLAQILNQFELVEPSQLEYHSAEHIHALVEAERRAYADRAYFMGDPDFVDMPIRELISDAYAAQRWQDVSLRWATPSEDIEHGSAVMIRESRETTHYSVVDRWGNAVSVTISLNGLYGSGEVVAGAGFLLNNEMDDFAIQLDRPNMFGLTGSSANAIEPGKRMLSSMTPTIVTRNDSLLLVIGSPGGPTIITTVAQIIINVVDFGMGIKEAVEAPRFHHQWMPNEIVMEPRAFGPETRQRLVRMGHKVRIHSDPSHYDTIGSAHCIYVDAGTGWYFGAADSRRESGAAGY
ncbi:MAG: gamma-glutamyltransferase [Candidatus Marinimicrobia bacterium]|nr:gamma-glutamyltransferase [Candidatus Neomarinimicrobiota bacterium]